LFHLYLLLQVLGDGQLLEFDTPQNLRANPNSYFSSLMNQMNSTRSNQLETISEIDNTTQQWLDFDRAN
jgi:ABC-type proline/glycine betaine transport system ATPase subunit